MKLKCDSKIQTMKLFFRRISQLACHNNVSGFSNSLLFSTVISSITAVDYSMGFLLDEIRDLRWSVITPL